MICLVYYNYFSENLRIMLIAPGHIFYTDKEIRFNMGWMCNGDT